MFKRYVYSEGFTSLINSDDDYSIDINGTVKDYKGEVVVPAKDADGHLTVNVFTWNGQRDYRVIDLIVLHFKDLQVPRKDYGDVLAFVMDGNKENTHAQNVGYRFRQKIESRDFPGFYYVPAFTRIVINEKGEAINSVNGKPIKWTIVKPGVRNSLGGYRSYGYVVSGLTFSYSRHRALCLTFKDYPDNVDSLTVNHIDGVPGNDGLDNLEWATRSWNNTHAYINDLKKQHKRVLSRDVLTGEVVEYYSVSECARVLGYTKDEHIGHKLRNQEFCAVDETGKQFKYKDDERDWAIPDDPAKAVQEAKYGSVVVLRNCLTLEERSYVDAAEAARQTGLNHPTILWRLNHNNKTPLVGFQVKRYLDPNPWPEFTQKEYEDSFLLKSFEVECRNLLTGETREYESVNKASHDLDKFTIADFLRNGEQPLYPDGWQVKFKGEVWEEISDFEEVLYKMTRDITGRCEQTGNLILASNAAEMAKILGKDPKAIRAAAMTRGRKVYHGYRFRLGIDDEPWPAQ